MLFIFILFPEIVYANNDGKVIYTDKEKAITLLVYNEQIIAALKLFTVEVATSKKNKDLKEMSDNIYWIAECLFQLKKFTHLEAVLKKTELLSKQNNLVAYSKLKTIEGKYLIEKGKYDDCILLLTKTVELTKNNTILCEIQLTLADANQRKQLLENSFAHYQYVIKNAKDTIQMARAYNGLGSYYCVVSNLDSAKICYDIAYNKFRNYLGAQHSRTAQVHYNLGLVADRNFDLFVAEQHFIKALTIYQTRLGNIHPRTAETYGTLGSLFLMKDNPEKALSYSIKERDILIQLYGKQHPDLAYSYLNCGKIYYLLNNPIESEQQLKSAIKLVINFFGKSHNLYSQCIVELSKIYTSQKKYNEATQILSEVIQLKQNKPDDYFADVIHQSAENYLEQSNFTDAVQQFRIANSLYIQYYGNKNIYSIEPLIGLSNVFLQQKKYREAFDMAEAALTMTIDKERIIYPYGNWKCMVQIFQCKKMLFESHLVSAQNIKKEIELVKQTIKKANTIKHTLYSTGSQVYFAEKMTELNQLGTYFLTHFYKKKDTYFLNQLLAFAENNRANLLRSKLVNFKSNEILPKIEQKLASQISSKLNFFNSLNENQIQVKYNTNDSILFYQNKFEDFTKSIEKKYPKIFSLKYGDKNLSIKQIQKMLSSKCTFLEYFNDDENYYCLSIAKNDIAFINCGKKTKIDLLINSYQTSILEKRFDKEVANVLSKMILPISLQQNLVVSQDEQLFNVAFDALTKNGVKADYLVQHHTIQYAFSANTYFKNRNSNDNKTILAVFPNFHESIFVPLNSKKEQNILNDFTNYDALIDSEATKVNFIKKINLSGIIHFGSHLIIDTIAPLKSALVFQPSGKYLMTINEIWKLNLNTQLITIAACQSNFGKQQSGEGLQNFAWAFYYAGARNILSTQWNASDKSTSTIICDFYKNLKSGKPKQEALQLAKISYLESTDAIGAQPFFWSNFCLYGDKSPIKISPHFLVKLWWMPVLLLLLCYLAIVIIQKVYGKKRYEHL